MPIYHFTVRRFGHKYEDQNGISFKDIDGAWEEATTAAGQMVKDLDGELTPGTLCSIEVSDEFYNTIRTVSITIQGPKR
jgi:hypothetical protein